MTNTILNRGKPPPSSFGSLEVFSSNGEKAFARWVFTIRNTARKRLSFVPTHELKNCIANDPQPTSLSLLKLMTSAVMAQKRDPINPNYYFVAKKGEEKLFAGFLVEKDKISAPAPHNLSSRQAFSPFVLEIWQETSSGEKTKLKRKERIIVTIIGGRLEVLGNSSKLLTFLGLK